MLFSVKVTRSSWRSLREGFKNISSVNQWTIFVLPGTQILSILSIKA